MEVLDRGVVQVPGQREVDRVVRRRRTRLPALRVKEPLPGRVPVDVEGEVEAVVEAHDRLRLRLGGRRRPAVRVARRDARGALLVVLPVRRVVAVRVDTVADLGRSVCVVVAQVLPPEAGVRARERVLVAVRIGDDDEPELVLPQELLDLLVAGPPAVHEVLHQPAVDLGRDPLARVLRRRVEDRRLAAVLLAGVLRDLESDELPALDRAAEDDQLRDARVVPRDRVELRAMAVGTVVVAPDVEAVHCLEGGELPRADAVLVLEHPDVDALLPQRGELVVVEHDLELDLPAAAYVGRGNVVALARQVRVLGLCDDRPIHVERERIGLLGPCHRRPEREQHGGQGEAQNKAFHRFPSFKRSPG